MPGAKARPADAEAEHEGGYAEEAGSMTSRRAIRSEPMSDPTPKKRGQDGVGHVAAPQVALGEQREEHDEVERQGADDGHEQQRDPQVVDRHGVAEARAELALGPGDGHGAERCWSPCGGARGAPARTTGR